MKAAKTETFSPRKWQADAADILVSRAKRMDRSLVFACPGAGKTFAGLYIAKRISDKIRKTSRMIVVTPNLAIKTQWIARAASMGIELREVRRANDLRQSTMDMGFGGFIVSYQQACADVRIILREYVETHHPIVILDEVHHTSGAHGEREGNVWGTICETIFDKASFKLCMTGTPFKEKTDNPIAFVDYNDNGEAVSDIKYTYADAISDGVCRPISFYSFDGKITWRNGRGDVVTASFDDPLTKALSRQRLSAAFDAGSDFTATMLRAADAKLSAVRNGEGVDATAGGLIVARDTRSADAIADFMEGFSGERPVVVHNKIDEAHALIETFRSGTQRWIIGINMLSEGVDIPRLRVGVYASKVRTRLYFHQFCGRFVRIQESRREHSFMFIPSDPEILGVAREIEKEVFHVLDDEPRPAPISRRGNGRRGSRDLEVIAATNVREKGTLYKGRFYPVDFLESHFSELVEFRRESPELADLQDVQILDIMVRWGRIPAPDLEEAS